MDNDCEIRNGGSGLCKWQDKPCEKVKMDCILRRNTRGINIAFSSSRCSSRGGNEKCEVCPSRVERTSSSSPTGGQTPGDAQKPSVAQSRAAETQRAALCEVYREHQRRPVWHHCPFRVQAVHYGPALFAFYVTVGKMNKVICMQSVSENTLVAR